MEHKILIVDDEPNILATYKRQYQRQCQVDTAESGMEGMEKILESGEYEVVISDFRMPEMDGVEFLAFVRQMAPDTVRILHTGYADLETAIGAVNEGGIFRLLTKPCSPPLMVRSLMDGFRQYELVKSERFLLENTVRGTMKVLTDVLTLIKPEVYGRVTRIAPIIQKLSQVMGDPQPWQTASAGFLAFLGFISFPDALIKKIADGEPLTAEEAVLTERHPEIARDIIAQIPRMEEVAEIIAFQNWPYSGKRLNIRNIAGDEIPLGSRILKVAIDFDVLKWESLSITDALKIMNSRNGLYDPKVLAALEDVVTKTAQSSERYLFVRDIEEEMVFLEDVVTLKQGRRLFSRGQVVTPAIIQALHRNESAYGVAEPIKVMEQFI